MASKPRTRAKKPVSSASNALDLEHGVLTLPTAEQIARSLKKSAEGNRRREAHLFQSAMSMLNLEINRAGKNLAPAQRRKLERTQQELRKAFGRPARPG